MNATLHLTERERLFRHLLESAPILSQYHGQRGFEAERFIDDFQAWRLRVRQALELSKSQ